VPHQITRSQQSESAVIADSWKKTQGSASECIDSAAAAQNVQALQHSREATPNALKNARQHEIPSSLTGC
jgi:hypothetical protein